MHIDVTVNPSQDLMAARTVSFVRKLLIEVRRTALVCSERGLPWMDQLHCPAGVAMALESSFTFTPYLPKVPLAVAGSGMIGHAAGFDVHVDHALDERELRLGMQPELARQARISAVLDGTPPETHIMIYLTTNYDLM